MFYVTIVLMFKGLLDLIYKNKCLVCNCSKTDGLLCKTCAKNINYLSSFPQKIYNNVPIYCASIYESTVKKLISLLKFSHKKKASIVLAEILFNYYKKLNFQKDFVIIYPNSFCLKKFSRGYEHMYLIAKEFSILSNLKLYKNSIIKIKNTIPQFKAKDRYKNVKNSFKIKNVSSLKYKSILLIDDIMTSGATLEEIINILQKEDINDITCITISKAIGK